ncbi:hypothetical protein [Geopsychrobacter electrodiphilus]|uniref:hypothetical protein n=1 Tax=Geopsychrobacter electrodiphilus TaxID=225196 RepID=UPI000367D93C|nr:hypothetical protein [Geopsychrobacter electrodiphilus]
MKAPNPTSTREAWVLCLILGMIMLNFPFLQIFNTGSSIFGIPILIFYFFIGWPISIFVIFLFVNRLQHEEEVDHIPDNDEDQ